MKPRTYLLTATMLSLATVAACSAAPYGASYESSSDGLTAAGGTSRLVFLGSQSFLMRCAGSAHVLGCGARVMSIPDSTPYFSAPWPHSGCNQWYTVRHGTHCVEAQRLEVSDSHAQMEGNPGLFDGLGLAHSDGTHCAGSGGAEGVTFAAGRHCNDSASSASGAKDSNESKDGSDADAGEGTSPSGSSSGDPKGGGSSSGSSGDPKGGGSSSGDPKGGGSSGSSGSSGGKP